ncbi:MAG: hypothetical protein RR800_05195 [Comamonas sp.]
MPVQAFLWPKQGSKQLKQQIYMQPRRLPAKVLHSAKTVALAACSGNDGTAAQSLNPGLPRRFQQPDHLLRRKNAANEAIKGTGDAILRAFQLHYRTLNLII